MSTDINRLNGDPGAVALTPANIFSGRCVLRPLRSAERLQDLEAAAAKDEHVVIAPTHLATKGDRIIGYISLGGAPLLHVWVDSATVHAGEAVRLLETAEALLADKHAGLVLMPCAEESPFTSHMERLGYRKLGPTVLWVKQI